MEWGLSLNMKESYWADDVLVTDLWRWLTTQSLLKFIICLKWWILTCKIYSNRAVREKRSGQVSKLLK